MVRRSLAASLNPAHLVWLLERRHKKGIISNRNYFPGIFEAGFWGLSTLTLQSEGMPRQWAARVLSILWMFAGVVFVASYTARLTSTLTIERIVGSIEGPGDLPGKKVATLASSITVDYLREQNAQVQEFASGEMFRALLDKKVDAIVAPSPLLLYYGAHEGKGRVRMVGPVFNTKPVAIELQELEQRMVWTVYFEADKNCTFADAIYSFDTIQGLGAQVAWITPHMREELNREAAH
jgi:polar amino acid transport system substrate-binding protein